MTQRIVRTIVFLGCLLTIVWSPSGARGESAKELYFKADACYKTLRNQVERQKYRSYWLKCIEQYNAVYLKDPEGSWAAAGLFMAARLHRELYRRSYRAADNTAAEVLFRKIVQQYPDSRYSRRASEELAAARKTGAPPSREKTAAAAKAVAAADEKAGRLYREAGKCQQQLKEKPRLQKYRDRWLRCIDAYSTVNRTSPSGPWAAAGLYRQAELYLGMYGHSYRQADRRDAIARLRSIVADFPDSRYHPRALKKLGELKVAAVAPPSATPKKKAAAKQAPPSKPVSQPTTPSAASAKTASGKPRAAGDAVADMIHREKSKTATAPGDRQGTAKGMVTVSGLRFWSNPNYTRIVIDASDEAVYRHHLLKEDPSIHKPKRLFVDLAGSRLGSGVNRVVPINDDLLSDARAGQFTAEIVRVVVDIKSIRTYKVFSLKNPFRIVIDLWGKNSAVAGGKGAVKKTKPPASKGGKIAPGSIARQLALGVSRVVIDPGHGGKDPGALGYKKGVREKQVTLQIANILAKKIKSRLGCEVVLTRKRDRFLSLEERTAIANTKNADIFISIHVNSHRSRSAYGIETYFLNLATDDDAIRVAAIENATSTKNISDLQSILNDLMQNAKINESSRLATRVQNAMYGHMRKRYSKIRSKGVKQAPFYVLLGAQMPAILIETSFISNPRECSRLVDRRYQSELCEGIVNGLERYIRETSPTALLKKGAGNNG